MRQVEDYFQVVLINVHQHLMATGTFFKTTAGRTSALKKMFCMHFTKFSGPGE